MSTLNVIYLPTIVNFSSDNFRDALKNGLLFILENEGPYLVHCSYGKDRAGFFSMFLECLLGYDLSFICDDYYKSYENFYGKTDNQDYYDKIIENNVYSSLSMFFGLDSLEGVDLQQCAYSYLLDLGLTAEQIDQLIIVLSE
ncbi:MAG: tyrosine-protein phosphatase [Sphaerochaetaceae bacterium]|nr:tyrosine-protein phosphatase [Sphaerochaetaceae bacterium]